MNDADFRTLILAELDAVFRLASHLARNSQEAEDLVQETYLRALRSSQTFTLAEFGVRPWLFKILHNVIVSRAVKDHRDKELLNDHRDSFGDSAAETAVGDCDTVIDWDQIDERLMIAVAELAMPFRTAFLLSAVEGLKYHEIANVTEVPVGTVMSRLSRARATLAKRLIDLARENGLPRVMKLDSKRMPLDS